MILLICLAEVALPAIIDRIYGYLVSHTYVNDILPYFFYHTCKLMAGNQRKRITTTD
jgi:hypothetical protein